MAASLPAGATCRAGTAQGVLLACATVLVVITISPLFPILPRIAATYAANPAYASLATSAVVLPSLLIGLFSVPAGLLGERVGRRRVLVAGNAARAIVRGRVRLQPSVRRRHADPGARSRPRTHEDGAAVGLRPRATTVERSGTAGCGLFVCAGSQSRTARLAS